jgi:2-octaprenyl-6-methoxyphenol hydroxylase
MTKTLAMTDDPLFRVCAEELAALSNAFEFDVLIVGAGMVGSALAAALRHTSLKVGLIDARETATRLGADGRSSALALGTVQLLDQIGAWDVMKNLGVSPIHQIQVSDGEFPQVARLGRQEIRAEALGYVVENQVTQTGLLQILADSNAIAWICPAQVESIHPHTDHIQVQVRQGEIHTSLKARLLVGADGVHSRVRQLAQMPVSSWGYGQVCMVVTVTTENPHHQTAYERFQPSGPFAILPMTDPATSSASHLSCVVWTIRQEDREPLLSLPDADFIQAIAPSFGPQLGQILTVSPRACYTPMRLNCHTYTAARLALVGDAAHCTHPVGGQGVNLGMRDVVALANVLIQADLDKQDPGCAEGLRRYQRWRQLDNRGVLLATDLANRLFSNTWLPCQWSRRLGLIGLDRILPIKQFLMRQAMGIAPYHPRLQNSFF